MPEIVLRETTPGLFEPSNKPTRLRNLQMSGQAHLHAVDSNFMLRYAVMRYLFRGLLFVLAIEILGDVVKWLGK
jgi:hypothetical protein